MKFYTFHQSNCYGAYETAVDIGIGVNVIIEAENPAVANDKAREIGLRLDVGCDWCDRWQSQDEEDGWDGGTVVPLVFETPVWSAPDDDISRGLPSFIHWGNGTVTRVDHQKGDDPTFSRTPEGWRQMWQAEIEEKARRDAVQTHEKKTVEMTAGDGRVLRRVQVDCSSGRTFIIWNDGQKCPGCDQIFNLVGQRITHRGY
jgi:hypothetical protein